MQQEQTSTIQDQAIESLRSEIVEVKNQLIQSNLIQQKANISQQKILNGVKEVAVYTNLSESCIYKHTSAGNIPHFCPNGKVLVFLREAVDEWLLTNPIKTKAEIEQIAASYVTLGKKRRSKK
jgi:excisionase family DNA binding protein